MVDLNAHEAGNGGKKPREAYSSPSLLYSENACLSRRRPRGGDISSDRTDLGPSGCNHRLQISIGRNIQEDVAL
jgi:hypothetical protein